jgi:hypothetical protein
MSQYSEICGSYAAAVVPSDVTTLGQFPRIYIGGAGNVTVEDVAGNAVLFTAPPVGSLLPIRVSRVRATGTTATAMVACW